MISYQSLLLAPLMGGFTTNGNHVRIELDAQLSVKIGYLTMIRL